MIVLRFEKYGTLFRYNGVPVYVGNRLITRKWMCWWWPINWLACVLMSPIVVYRILRNRT